MVINKSSKKSSRQANMNYGSEANMNYESDMNYGSETNMVLKLTL